MGCSAYDTILYIRAESQQQDAYTAFVADMLQSRLHLNVNMTFGILLNNTSVRRMCSLSWETLCCRNLNTFAYLSFLIQISIKIKKKNLWEASSLTVTRGSLAVHAWGFVSPICHDVSQAGRKQGPPPVIASSPAINQP